MLKNFIKYNNNIKIILITNLLSSIGIYMVIPFLAIYLSNIDTVSLKQVGIIIGASFWCQKAGSFFGGLISDYLSAKGTMILGLVLRIPGYIFIGYTTSFYPLLISCCLIGLGSSIYIPAAKSFLVKISTEEDKVNILSTRIVFSNIGASVGPLIGMSVFSIAPSILFLSVALIFAILTIFNVKIKNTIEDKITNNISLSDFKKLLTNKSMIYINVFSFLVMSFYVQIDSTIPIFVNSVFNHAMTSSIFICNAIIVIFFQSIVSKWSCKGSAKKSLMLGFFLLSICFLLMDYSSYSYIILFLAVIFFSFAEIIIFIRLDYDATNINKSMIATTFGIMSLYGAFGCFFGSYIGGIIYLPGLLNFNIWQIFAISCAIITVSCYFLRKNNIPNV